MKLFAASVLALAAGVANAGITGGVISIDATCPDGQGGTCVATWSLEEAAGQWTVNDQGFDVWVWEAPIGWAHEMQTLHNGEIVTLATLNSTAQNRFRVEYISDPVINLSFNAIAGPVATNFSINSGLLGYAAFNGVAKASAGISVTDSDGDGAMLTGTFGGGAAYRAAHNTGPFAAFNLNTLVAAPWDTTTTSATTGAFAPVGVTAGMIAGFDFRLSANDQAAGTSSFVTIVPAPGAVALMGIAGLAGARCRR